MSESEAIVVEFELTPEDWVDASAAHIFASTLGKKQVGQVQLLFGVLIGLVMLLNVVDGFMAGAVLWGVLGLPLVTLMPSFIRSAQRKQLEKISMDGIANGMFGKHRVELMEQGMRDSTAGYEWLTRWHSIDEVKEADGAYLVYTGRNAYLPIPHSAFRDSATLRAFADRFFTKLNEARDPGLLEDPEAES